MSGDAPEAPSGPGLETALDLLFREARSRYRWSPDPVPETTLRSLYELLKLGPTSANSSPARFLFLVGEEQKARLRPALSAGNVDKAMTAPVVAIVAYDPAFYERLPELFPHVDARAWFADDPMLAHETAFRNGTLQGAYMILAARALGLDAGPMSGFDNAAVDRAFFAELGWRSNFICALGHADPAVPPHPRLPRLGFDEACRLL